MTERQERFIEEYCLDCNGAAAARRAGYSVDRAKQEAYDLLRDVEVAGAIKERLDNMAMTAEVAVKHLSDVASTRLNDFMIIRQVQGREQTEQYVTVLLANVQEEIQSIRDFMDRELPEKKGRRPFLRDIEKLQKLALEYQREISRFGNEVTRFADGRPCVVEIAELDMVALAKAKDLGRIKTYTVTENGVKIEMYAADAAAKSILEFHGKIVQHHEHKFAELDKLNPDELDQLRRIQEAATSRG